MHDGGDEADAGAQTRGEFHPQVEVCLCWKGASSGGGFSKLCVESTLEGLLWPGRASSRPCSAGVGKEIGASMAMGGGRQGRVRTLQSCWSAGQYGDAANRMYEI